MCTLEDAWGPLSAQQRQQFAAAPNKSMSSFGEQAQADAKQHWQSNNVQWYKGGPPKTKPSFGHYGCAGGFSEEPQEQPERALVVPASTSSDRKTEIFLVQQPAHEESKTECMDAFEHVVHCSKCSRRLGRYCATLYDQRQAQRMQQQQQQPSMPNWWQWLLIVLGIAILAAFLVRLFQPSRPYIVRQIGYQ